LTFFVLCTYAGKVPDALKRLNKIKGAMNDHVHRLDSIDTIPDRFLERIAKWTAKIQDMIENMDTNCPENNENTDEEETRLIVAEDDICLANGRISRALLAFTRRYGCQSIKREKWAVKRIKRSRNVVDYTSGCPRSSHPHYDVLIDIKRNLEKVIVADKDYYANDWILKDEDPGTVRECRANIEENMTKLLKKLSYATDCKPDSQGPYHPDIKLETEITEYFCEDSSSSEANICYEDFLLSGSGRTNLYKQISRFLQDYACENPVKEKDWDPFWLEIVPSTSDPNPSESILLYHFLGDTARAQQTLSTHDTYGIFPKEYSLEGIWESLIGCSGMRPLSIS